MIGFNVRPDSNAKKIAENEGVQIRLYQVIYDMLDDVKAAMAVSYTHLDVYKRQHINFLLIYPPHLHHGIRAV